MPPITIQGVVTKVGYMNKTATVTVTRWVVHPRTQKRYETSKKYLTHDPENKLRQDDEVLIRNCPPVSARKRFALYKILSSRETEWERRHQQEAEALATEGKTLLDAKDRMARQAETAQRPIL